MREWKRLKEYALWAEELELSEPVGVFAVKESTENAGLVSNAGFSSISL